jgi:hypothetical protein
MDENVLEADEAEEDLQNCQYGFHKSGIDISNAA